MAGWKPTGMVMSTLRICADFSVRLAVRTISDLILLMYPPFCQLGIPVLFDDAKE